MCITISLPVIPPWKWQTGHFLYVQRLRQIMIEVYKVYHNIGPVYMGIRFNKVDQFDNSRCIKPLEQPSFNAIANGCNSFTYQGAKDWNPLSRVFKEAPSVADFKVMIRTYNDHQRNCSFSFTKNVK